MLTAQAIYEAMRADAETSGVDIDPFVSAVEDRGGKYGRYVALADDVSVRQTFEGSWIVRDRWGHDRAEFLPTTPADEVARATIDALHDL